MPTGSGRPRLVTNTPVMTADSVITVPIERSMPPLMMTNVTPMARMPLTAVASRIPMTLLGVAKYGDSDREDDDDERAGRRRPAARWTASERKNEPWPRCVRSASVSLVSR